MLQGWVQTNLQTSLTIVSVVNTGSSTPIINLQYTYSPNYQLSIGGHNILNVYQANNSWLFFLIQVDLAGTQLTVYFSQPQSSRDYYNKYTLSSAITLQQTGQIKIAPSISTVYSNLVFFNAANFASSYQQAQSMMFYDFEGYLYSFKLDQVYSSGLFMEDLSHRYISIQPLINGQTNKALFSPLKQAIYLSNNVTNTVTGAQDYSTFLITNTMLSNPFQIGFFFRVVLINQFDNNIMSITSEYLSSQEVLSLTLIQNSIKIVFQNVNYKISSDKLIANQWYYISIAFTNVALDSSFTYQSMLQVTLMQTLGQSSFRQVIYLASPLSVASSTYSLYFGYIPPSLSQNPQNTGFTGYISRILITQGGALINNNSQFRSTCTTQNQCDVLFIGRSGSSCSICSSGQYNKSTFDTNVCSSTSCSSGYYFSNEFMICQVCNSACQTCFGAGQNSCVTCTKGYYSYKQSCFQTCPSGYYISDSQNLLCELCSPSCQSCTGPAIDQCTSCSPGFFLSSNTCTPCDTSCTLCTDLVTCQSCSPNYFLDSNNSCITSCPSGQYSNIFNQCLNCTISNCSQCTSAGICTTCADGYYLTNNQCASCDSSCAKCYGGDNKSCFSCSTNKYLYISTCLSYSDCSTLNGYFPNYDTLVCQNCTGSCQTCTSQTQCTSCINGYYFSNGQCLPCPSSCASCSSSSVCTSCLPTYFLDNNNNCSSSCPDGTYSNTTNQECTPCVTGCLTCFGPTLLECYTCVSGYFFQPLAITTIPQQGTCIACDMFCLTCTSRYFCTSCTTSRFMKIYQNQQTCTNNCGKYYLGDESTYLCTPCQQGCQTCSVSPSNCQSCITGYYNQNGKVCSSCPARCVQCQQAGYCTQCADGFLLINNNCSKICSSGYPDNVNNLCVPCHPTCSTCTGALATNCTTCITGFYMDTTYNMCRVCNLGCSSCTSKTVCTACNTGYNMYNTECRINCPPGTFLNNYQCQTCVDPKCAQCTPTLCVVCKPGFIMISNTCQACDPSCATCFGTTAQSCLSCNAANGLYLSVTSCLAQCPQGQYLDTTKNQCFKCYYSCSTCFGPSQNQCNTCIANGFFLTNGSTCQICDQSCLKCSGPGFDSCITCAPGYYLLGTTVCVQSCPSGFYLNSSNTACLECNSVCNTCTGSKNTDCTSCSDGYYQSISNQQNIICSACNPKCLTCNGAFSSNCLLCSTGYVQYNNQCLITCPSGYRNIGGICTICPTNCGYCVAQNGSQVCTQCLTGYLLNQANNSCIQSCPTGTFQTYINNGVQQSTSTDVSFYYCSLCSSSCQACTQSSTNCTKCVTGYILHQTINECVLGTSCLNGFISQVDQNSNVYCMACTTNCIACISQMYMFQGNCYSSCPSGTTQISQSNICVTNLLPQLTILTNPATLSFQEDLTIQTSIVSNIQISSMNWSLLDPSSTSIKGAKFLQNLILNGIDTLYVPLSNLVPSTVYTVQFTISNSKGSVTQKIKINTNLMMTPGTINCQPNQNIIGGTTPIQVQILNFVHTYPLMFDYFISPATNTTSTQTINGITQTSQNVIAGDDLFIGALNTNNKQFNLTTFQIRSASQMQVIVDVYNSYVFNQTSTPVQFLQGAKFSYNTSQINSDLSQFDQMIAAVIASSNQLTLVSQYANDVRTIKQILNNYINNAYSIVDQSIYLQNSFMQLIDNDVGCRLNLCMNSGSCVSNSVQCNCTPNYTGLKCQFDIKQSQQLSTYLGNILGFIEQNIATNVNNDQLINILMDITFFRDMVTPSVYSTYFQILGQYTSQKITKNSSQNLQILTSQTLANCLLYIFDKLNPIINNYQVSVLPNRATYLQTLANLRDISVLTIVTAQNTPLNFNSPYHYYASIGVITSSMFPQILQQYQNQSQTSSSTSSSSSSLLVRNLQSNSGSGLDDNETEQSGVVGYEFGTGLDVLQAIFNFPVIQYSSNRHFLYLPQSIITSLSNFRILVAEIFNIASVIPYTSQVLSDQYLLATGFFSVVFSQEQQIIPFVNEENPLTIILPKMVAYPVLNYTNPQQPVYNCLHYDSVKDVFENQSCFFQRENSTHIACSCYTLVSAITVEIIKSNIKNMPSYNDIILMNTFSFDAYVNEKLSIYKLVNNITSGNDTYTLEEEKYQQLIILQNYYGIYIMIVITIGVSLVLFGYSSIKAKYLDNKINTKDHTRTYFLYYFPVLSFFIGPTNQFVSSFTRAITALTIIAAHFAFSSLYLFVLPFDMTTTLYQNIIAIITVSSTSVMIYWTIGINHMISVGLNNKMESEQKGLESKWKVVEGFKFQFGVTMISVILSSFALISLSVIVGVFGSDQLNLWVEVIKKVFLLDLIVDGVVVIILLIVGSESIIGSFFSLRGFGITLQQQQNLLEDNKVK